MRCQFSPILTRNKVARELEKERKFAVIGEREGGKKGK